MIRVLVLHDCGRKNDLWTKSSNDASKGQGVLQLHLEMHIAAQIEKFHARTQKRRCLFRFLRSLLRRAVSGRFSTRTNYKVRCSTCLRFARNDTAATKLDIIGVCTKREELR